MTKRYLISVEPIEPSGVVLTIAELPGLVIFGQTAEDALGWAREAIAFQSLDSRDYDQRPQLELVLDRVPASDGPPRRSPFDSAPDSHPQL